MATKNPFDLLDDDTEDPSLLIAVAEQQKIEKPKKAPASAPAQAQPAKAAKLPAKPPPPAQAGNFFFLNRFLIVFFVLNKTYNFLFFWVFDFM